MEEQSKLHIELCGLKDIIDERFGAIGESLNRIETQTTKTNGRVRSLEVWKGVITGALSIITILILPIFFVIFKSWLD